MISESRTRKYLLYAVGEIMLVVIGILIALQVDNWNEDRRKHQQAAEFRMQLQEGILQDMLLEAESLLELLKTEGQ